MGRYRWMWLSCIWILACTSLNKTHGKRIPSNTTEAEDYSDIFDDNSFVRIEAGGFYMGSLPSEEGRRINEGQVYVEISRPFEVMTKEVTQGQWVKVMGGNPSWFRSRKHCASYQKLDVYAPGWDEKVFFWSWLERKLDFRTEWSLCPDHPVENVSWGDVQKFIAKLNSGLECVMVGWQPRGPGCYRLPTEAEWEYMARAGSQTAYFFGDGDKASRLNDYAVYGTDQTQPVGSKKPNDSGLFDILGNVGEWVQDTHHDSLRGLPGGKDPLVQHMYYQRVYDMFRGGHFSSHPRDMRSAYRGFVGTHSHKYVGFRLVRNLDLDSEP